MRSIWKAFAVVAVATILQWAGIMPAMADMMTQSRLSITDQSVSTASRQTLKAVTPTGVDDPTDTIVLEYAPGFSLAGLTDTDFSLGVDDDNGCDGPFAAVALGAVPAAGQWGVAVAGQAITFSAPTDAAPGEIPESRCLEIGIGDANQIVNPGTAGSYEIDVYGTFDDQTLFSVGIVDDTQVSVSATVGDTDDSTRGPDPDPDPADTTAPVISNIVVSSITETSAVVTWETDEPAST